MFVEPSTTFAAFSRKLAFQRAAKPARGKFCTACGNHQEKRKLYQSFFGVFSSYHAFDAVFTQCTSDWKCIVLDQTQPSPSVENSVFWFKADVEAEKAPFRLCKPIFWAFAAHGCLLQSTAA